MNKVPPKDRCAQKKVYSTHVISSCSFVCDHLPLKLEPLNDMCDTHAGCAKKKETADLQESQSTTCQQVHSGDEGVLGPNVDGRSQVEEAYKSRVFGACRRRRVTAVQGRRKRLGPIQRRSIRSKGNRESLLPSSLSLLTVVI